MDISYGLSQMMTIRYFLVLDCLIQSFDLV